LSSPQMSGRRAIVSCGPRSVLTTQVKVESEIKVGNANGIQVLERIGFLPPSDQAES
jgi:hypothetical protein